jgi:hypothetical protein
MSDSEKCPECQGQTIEFRGKGSSLQWRRCSKTYDEPEKHLSEDGQKALWNKMMLAHKTKSGRFG